MSSFFLAEFNYEKFNTRGVLKYSKKVAVRYYNTDNKSVDYDYNLESEFKRAAISISYSWINLWFSTGKKQDFWSSRTKNKFCSSFWSDFEWKL